MAAENDTRQLLSLVCGLRDHAEFEHHIERFEIIETHISYILLTGPYAYKFKKPVDFGFLDFSTLEKRRFYCYEELRLNRRLAPELYLEVVPITGSTDYPELGGGGEVLEYAVKMVQFDRQTGLEVLLQSGRLTRSHLDELAQEIAAFHDSVPHADEFSRLGAPDTVWRTMSENFSQIKPCLRDDVAAARVVEELERWSAAAYQRLAQELNARKRGGFIRECHGDMHLGNMVLHAEHPLIFDCIEFSENLRWIDVISEIAFLAMDLESRGQPRFAYRLLNRYLGYTGDYGGVVLLQWYCIYRALVRVKVSCLTLGHAGLDPDAANQQRDKYRHYLDYARQTMQHHARPGMLIIAHGLSGSGKSTVVEAVSEYLGAIALRTDLERKRLCRLSPDARTRSGIGSGIYTDEITRQTYEHLRHLAETILQAGYTVIMDGAFLQEKYRSSMRELAHALHAPFVILDVQAEARTLRRRVLERGLARRDASEANSAVLSHQMTSAQPLDDEERHYRVLVNTDLDVNYLRLVDEINKLADNQALVSAR